MTLKCQGNKCLYLNTINSIVTPYFALLPWCNNNFFRLGTNPWQMSHWSAYFHVSLTNAHNYFLNRHSNLFLFHLSYLQKFNPVKINTGTKLGTNLESNIGHNCGNFFRPSLATHYQPCDLKQTAPLPPQPVAIGGQMKGGTRLNNETMTSSKLITPRVLRIIRKNWRCCRSKATNFFSS